jgi:hypothetical protein
MGGRRPSPLGVVLRIAASRGQTSEIASAVIGVCLDTEDHADLECRCSRPPLYVDRIARRGLPRCAWQGSGTGLPSFQTS